MVQDYKNIAIIGAGASGCVCAYHLINSGYEVSIFDKAAPLRTLLPTGGGRCNYAHNEFNPIELARNYPRGEKFLYSVFSKFSTSDTIQMFENMGIKSYVQENGRIFPESNSAKEVRNIILNKIKKANFINEDVLFIENFENGLKLKTNKAEYLFSHVIVAIGGHSGYNIFKNLNIKLIAPKPALVGLNTKEDFKNLSGLVVKNAKCNGIVDDILFTHFGVSGPLVYAISSIKAFDTMPYSLSFDLCPELDDLQQDLNNFPHKEIKNIISKYLPHKLVNKILEDVDETTKAHQISRKIRDSILDKIHNFEINIVSPNKGEETVTAGGVDLNEINPKTMELKNIPNVYCIGEVLNIDGFCGGFNLQNAWSTAYVCAQALIHNKVG